MIKTIQIENYPENIIKINDIPYKSNLLIYLKEGVVPAIFNNFSDNIISFYGLDVNFHDRHIFTIIYIKFKNEKDYVGKFCNYNSKSFSLLIPTSNNDTICWYDIEDISEIEILKD